MERINEDCQRMDSLRGGTQMKKLLLGIVCALLLVGMSSDVSAHGWRRGCGYGGGYRYSGYGYGGYTPYYGGYSYGSYYRPAYGGYYGGYGYPGYGYSSYGYRNGISIGIGGYGGGFGGGYYGW